MTDHFTLNKTNVKKFEGLEKWFSILELLLLFQRTQVWCVVLMSSSSQLLVALVLGGPAIFFLLYALHSFIATLHRHTQINNENNLFYEFWNNSGT